MTRQTSLCLHILQILVHGIGARSSNTVDEQFNDIFSRFAQLETQLAQLLVLTKLMSQMDAHITNLLGGFSARLAEMEQNLSTLAARMCAVETGCLWIPGRILVFTWTSWWFHSYFVP